MATNVQSGAQPPGSRVALIALLVANTISMIGNSFAMIAIPWFVLETTGSATLTGLAGAATVLPNFVAGMLGGAVVDRIGPKQIAVLGEVFSGVSVAAIPLLEATGHLSFPLLFLLVVAGAIFDIPGTSARRTMAPSLAHSSGVSLQRVNAAFEALPSVAFLIGPPIAGLTVAALGASAALWIDAVSFAVSAALIAFLVPAITSVSPATGAVGSKVSLYLSDVREGLRFLLSEPAVRLIALSFLVINIFGGPFFAVVLPVWAVENEGTAAGVGILVAIFGGGAVAGAAIYGAAGDRWPRSAAWMLYMLSIPAAFWLLAVSPPAWLLATGLFLSGGIDGAAVAMSVTIRQERTPSPLMGRVFSASSAVAQFSAPIGMVLAGALLQRFEVTVALIVLAVIAQILHTPFVFVPAARDLGPRTPETTMDSAVSAG